MPNLRKPRTFIPSKYPLYDMWTYIDGCEWLGFGLLLFPLLHIVESPQLVLNPGGAGLIHITMATVPYTYFLFSFLMSSLVCSS